MYIIYSISRKVVDTYIGCITYLSLSMRNIHIIHYTYYIQNAEMGIFRLHNNDIFVLSTVYKFYIKINLTIQTTVLTYLFDF